MKLYKYYGENQFSPDRAFQENGFSVCFSRLSDLNDPFESRFNMEDLIPILFENSYKEFEKTKQKLEEELNINLKKEDIEKGYIDGFKRKIKEQESEIIRKIEEKVRVFCLSKTNNNKLMWSHYSDSYKGLCIEFEFDEKSGFPCDFENNIFKVKYQDHLLKAPYDITPNSKSIKEFTINMLTTKDLVWNYENEYRSLGNVNDLIIKNKNKNNFFTTTFVKTECISNIIFGFKCKEENINIVKEWIKKNKANHIQLSKVTLSSDSYDIKITPI